VQCSEADIETIRREAVRALEASILKAPLVGLLGESGHFDRALWSLRRSWWLASAAEGVASRMICGALRYR